MKIHIYLLKHPITDEIKYVGKTKNLQARLWNHVNKAKYIETFIQRWVKSLTDKGLKPVMEVIETCTENWDEREMYWIAYYSKTCQLANHTSGGEGHYGYTRANKAEVLTKIDKACELIIAGYNQQTACKMVGLAHSYITRVRHQRIPWLENYCIVLPGEIRKKRIPG